MAAPEHRARHAHDARAFPNELDDSAELDNGVCKELLSAVDSIEARPSHVRNLHA